MIAIPWYFAQQQNLAYFGLVYLITNLVSMIWVPVSGTLVDRYDRKRLFMAVTMTGGLLISLISAAGVMGVRKPATHESCCGDEGD